MVANSRLWHYEAGFFTTLFLITVRSFWRFFFTGKPVLGDPRDNATFFHEATADFSGHPIEHLSGALWRVVVWRWIFVGVPGILAGIGGVASIAQYFYEILQEDHPEMTSPPWTALPWFLLAAIWLGIATLSVTIWAIYRLVYFIKHRKMINDFVYPAWETACSIMGYHYLPRDARRMVSLPEGFSPPEIGIEVEETEPSPVLVWLLSQQKIYNLASRWLDIQRENDSKELESEVLKGEVLVDDNDSEPDNPSKDLVPAGHWPVIRWKRRNGSHALGPKEEEFNDEPVRINLPVAKAISDADKKKLVIGVGNVLGMPDARSKFVIAGTNKPYFNLYFNHPPPLVVTLKDVQKYIEAADIDHPFLGIAYGGIPVYLDYVDESPHILVSAKTGTGKSTMMKLFLCWRMHLGSGLMIADMKLVSHRWALGMAGCRYCWKISDIHEMLVDLGLQLEWRKETAIIPGSGPDDPLRDFRTLDVVLEEMNSLSGRLRSYWQSIKEPGDPAQSPAMQAVQDCINMGREFKIFMHIGAQRASAHIFGPDGGDSRESFSTRLISGLSPQTWKILVPGVPFQQFPPGPRGIWGVVRNGELVIFRVPNLTNMEAQQYALTGIPSPGQEGYDGTANGPETVDQDDITEPNQITLNRAVKPGFLPGRPMTISALRQATKRSGFPPAVGREGRELLYEEEALIEWKQNRDKIEIVPDAEIRRSGKIYQFMCRDWPNSEEPIIGYIGQTVQELKDRVEQHEFGRPWADLVIGVFSIWESEACTPEELDAMEQHYIRQLKPRFNIEFQIGSPWAVPKWEQIEQRQQRQRASGLPPWVPRNIYEEARG